MKFYSSFLIRCWLIRNEPATTQPATTQPAAALEAGEKFVFDVEHIQNGERLRATTPQEALTWMTSRLCTSPTAPAPETEDEPLALPANAQALRKSEDEQ